MDCPSSLNKVGSAIKAAIHAMRAQSATENRPAAASSQHDYLQGWSTLATGFSILGANGQPKVWGGGVHGVRVHAPTSPCACCRVGNGCPSQL